MKTESVSSMKKTSPVIQGQCSVCNSSDILTFIEISDVPVQCNLLWATDEEALKAPKGDITLGFCKTCGHIFNLSFDPDLMKYNQEYENSLFYSSRFQEYATSLAQQLIERYDLHDKDIIEIGCGKGDFLALLCNLGGNHGTGFDRSYEPERTDGKVSEEITFIQDAYSDRYANYKADFICCRHVLEHIQNPGNFLINLRKAIGQRLDTKIFFEVPDVLFTLRDLGIWDIIYEHCSYFSASSLSYLFRSCGFQVLNIKETFEGQFLCIEASPIEGTERITHDHQNNTQNVFTDVKTFADKYRRKVKDWHSEIKTLELDKKRIVVWGGGSKGITFLNIMKAEDQIEYVVDVNPHKHGQYIPGTGQKIIPPDYLQDYQPDLIIVMNPIYCQEIQEMMKSMGVSAKIVTA